MNESRHVQLRLARSAVSVLMVSLLGGCASLESHYQFRSNGGDAEVLLLAHPAFDSLQSQCALRVSTRSSGLQTSCNGSSR